MKVSIDDVFSGISTGDTTLNQPKVKRVLEDSVKDEYNSVLSDGIKQVLGLMHGPVMIPLPGNNEPISLPSKTMIRLLSYAKLLKYKNNIVTFGDN